jgi:hypothetical protein
MDKPSLVKSLGQALRGGVKDACDAAAASVVTRGGGVVSCLPRTEAGVLSVCLPRTEAERRVAYGEKREEEEEEEEKKEELQLCDTVNTVTATQRAVFKKLQALQTEEEKEKEAEERRRRSKAKSRSRSRSATTRRRSAEEEWEEEFAQEEERMRQRQEEWNGGGEEEEEEEDEKLIADWRKPDWTGLVMRSQEEGEALKKLGKARAVVLKRREKHDAALKKQRRLEDAEFAAAMLLAVRMGRPYH